jgi:hypothetical protein
MRLILFVLFIYLFLLNKNRPEGITFMVPKTDCVLHRRVVCGDVVSFTHDFTTRRATHDNATHSDAAASADDAEMRNAAHARAEIPSNPVVYRLRDDLAWEDVLQSSSLPPIRLFLNGLNFPPFFSYYIWQLTYLQSNFKKLKTTSRGKMGM